MKKILFLLFIATTFVACQKEDQNGDLGGFWKIMEIEEHATGTTTYLADKSHFWSKYPFGLSTLYIKLQKKTRVLLTKFWGYDIIQLVDFSTSVL